VTPLSLGVETLGGVMTKLIERNTTIPVKKTEVFSTAEDNQTSVDIHVLQGERPLAADNMTLGRFRLDGIPPAPRGIPQIEVTFDIDANGILSVTAKDKATGKEQKVTITASTNLNKADVERMVREAEQHKSEDERRKQLIEARNIGDSTAYQAEKLLRDMGDKVDAGKRSELEGKIKELRDAIAGDNLTVIQNATQAVQELMQAIGSAAYQQTQSGPAQGEAQSGPQQGGTEQGGDDVVDGEFHEA
jgi:molecular chaperone DnaK